MSLEDSSGDFSSDTSTMIKAEEQEEESLLHHSWSPQRSKSWFRSSRHVAFLYLTNSALLLTVASLWLASMKDTSKDPSLALYSPASDAVEYIEKQHFRAALLNTSSPYMGYPDDSTDKLWSDLYNGGISRITEEEAKLLHVPTLPIPGTRDYVIELDIYHELHCLNELRKLLYPERFKGMDDIKDENGIIDRRSAPFLHWDHCIDSIRQTLMCHADVSPISFHVNVPVNQGIFPRLATTHTCRNFTKIQEWAKEHSAGKWEFMLTPEMADEIIEAADFDQSPEEDIEFLYEQFPNNTFFKYWRDHPLPSN